MDCGGKFSQPLMASGFEEINDHMGYIKKAKARFGKMKEISVNYFNGKTYIHISDMSKCYHEGKFDFTKSKSVSLTTEEALSLNKLVQEAQAYDRSFQQVNHQKAQQYQQQEHYQQQQEQFQQHQQYQQLGEQLQYQELQQQDQFQTHDQSWNDSLIHYSHRVCIMNGQEVYRHRDTSKELLMEKGH